LTRQEVSKLIGIVVVSYPGFDKFREDDHIRALVDLWAANFADDTPDLVGLAVKKHICTSKWPPSIAEIKELIIDITHPDIIPLDEAWKIVQECMELYPERLYGSTDQFLPDLIAEAVDSIDYRTLWDLHCAHARGYSEKAGHDYLRFKQAYEPLYHRARERAMLPHTLCEEIDLISTSRSGKNQYRIDDLKRHVKKKRADLYSGENNAPLPALPVSGSDIALSQ